MVKVNIFGMMEEYIKDNIVMIKNMDMDNIIGLMEKLLKVTG